MITQVEIRISSRPAPLDGPSATVIVKWIKRNESSLRYMETQPGTEAEQARIKKHLEFLNWLLID